MKNSILFLFLILFSSHSFSQKKGKSKSKAKTTTISKTNLASIDGVIFEMSKRSIGNQLYLLLGKAKIKDTLLLKTLPQSVSSAPTNCKLKSFVASGVSLVNITWTENTTTGDSKSKLETATKVTNEIWDIATRNQALSNTQTTTNIKEIVFLDRLKNASETQEKNRREGAEFVLQPNGEVFLVTKAVTNTLYYSVPEKKFVFKKR